MAEFNAKISKMWPSNNPLNEMMLCSYYNGEAITEELGTVDVYAFAIVEVHNENSDNPDYMITAIKTADQILYTSSDAVRNSVEQILDTLSKTEENVTAVRMRFNKRKSKSTNYSYMVAAVVDFIVQ